LRPLEERTLTLSSAAFAELTRAVLDKGNRFRFCARGISMIPFIRDGDTLTIAPLASGAPRLGEVVAFSYPPEQGKELVVHRVVGRRRDGFIVRGDANGCAPEMISSENILGRVVRVEREGRYVRLGLGPERWLIAWMSRIRVLWSFVWQAWRAARQTFKRQTV